MSQVVPLELLKSGEQGRVCEIDGRSDFVHRLAEMGLRTGAMVRMLRPGSPCILDLDHQRLSFRADQVASVFVEVGP
ncbi:MAG TPA: FeoA family protein [Planctomycetaceae bacterium]|nr:FeoA family protein [Planctomycetaceae bacterium]